MPSVHKAGLGPEDVFDFKGERDPTNQIAIVLEDCGQLIGHVNRSTDSGFPLILSEVTDLELQQMITKWTINAALESSKIAWAQGAQEYANTLATQVESGTWPNLCIRDARVGSRPCLGIDTSGDRLWAQEYFDTPKLQLVLPERVQNFFTIER